MPDINYPYLAEGAEFDADSLNDRFTTVTNGVNDLMDYSSVRGAFHEDHLPSMVPGLGGPLTVDVKLGTVFNTQYVAFDSDAAWEVIESPGPETLEITFPILHLGMHLPDRLAGFWVLMNTQWQWAVPLGLGSVWAAFCIQWSGDLITWNTIPRTTRIIAGQGLATQDEELPASYLDPNYPDGLAYQDVALRTLILPSDLSGSQIRGIRGAVSWYEDVAMLGAPGVLVNSSSLSVIPLHAKEMP